MSSTFRVSVAASSTRRLSSCVQRLKAHRPCRRPIAAAAAGGATQPTAAAHPSQPPPLSQPHAAPPPPPPSPYELLLEGKRFTCTECGKCCQGSGEVWASSAECAAMASHLGLSQGHFLARYTKAYSRRPGWRMLKVQAATGDCVFLEGGTRCSIYQVRPMQCSTYPWWPELMDPGAPHADRTAGAAAEAVQAESVRVLRWLALKPGRMTPSPPPPPAAQLRGWQKGAPSARGSSTRRRLQWMRGRRRAFCVRPQTTLQRRRRRARWAEGASGRRAGSELGRNRFFTSAASRAQAGPN